MTLAGLYLSSGLLGALGAWVIARLAGGLGLLDHPNERSSHSAPTPRGGGIGILAAFVLASALTSIQPVFWLPAALIAMVGFLTDMFDLSPKVRLPIQFAAAGIFTAGAMNTSIPGFNEMMRPGFVVPALIYIVGTANFFNFMDGINGIAGITGLLGFGLLGFHLHLTGDFPSMELLAFSISFACAGFLPFNMPSARVFMGDVGSILLGFLFGGLLILLSKSLLDFICMASFLFPFYADELTTMIVRLRAGENLLQPHRRHIYQLLVNEMGHSHWKVSLGYGTLQLVVGLSVLLITPYGLAPVIGFLVISLAAFSICGLAVRRKATAALLHGSMPIRPAASSKERSA